jgi:hypothetical protein
MEEGGDGWGGVEVCRSGVECSGCSNELSICWEVGDGGGGRAVQVQARPDREICMR